MSVNTDGLGDSPANEQVSNPVIILPPNTSKFEAGGKMYFVESNLSTARYQHYQKMQNELGFGMNFSSIINALNRAYAALNERKDADAAVAIQMILERSLAVSEKKPIALYVATLFVNTADENRAEWDRARAEQKIEDWSNIDVSFFLGLCLARTSDLMTQYKEVAELLRSVSEVKSHLEGSIED